MHKEPSSLWLPFRWKSALCTEPKWICGPVRCRPARMHRATFRNDKNEVLVFSFLFDPTAGIVLLLCRFSTPAARLLAALYDFTITYGVTYGCGHIWLCLKQAKGHSLPTFLSLHLPLSPNGIHLTTLFWSVTTQIQTQSCTHFYWCCCPT